MTLMFFTFFFAACCVKRHHVLNSSLIVAWYEERKKCKHQAFLAFLLQATLRRADQSIKDLGATIKIDRRSSINSSRPETGQCLVDLGPFKASIWTRPSASNRSKIQSSDTDPVIANAFCGHNGTLQNQELRQVLPPLSPVMA